MNCFIFWGSYKAYEAKLKLMEAKYSQQLEHRKFSFKHFLSRTKNLCVCLVSAFMLLFTIFICIGLLAKGGNGALCGILAMSAYGFYRLSRWSFSKFMNKNKGE